MPRKNPHRAARLPKNVEQLKKWIQAHQARKNSFRNKTASKIKPRLISEYLMANKDNLCDALEGLLSTPLCEQQVYLAIPKHLKEAVKDLISFDEKVRALQARLIDKKPELDPIDAFEEALAANKKPMSNCSVTVFGSPRSIIAQIHRDSERRPQPQQTNESDDNPFMALLSTSW